MSDIEPVGLGFVAGHRGQAYAAAIGPDNDDVVLFSESPEEGFTQAAGYWRRQVPRAELEWLTLLRTVGAYGGEPCVVLDEDDTGDVPGLHIAYAGHSGVRAEALGYWLVDHGAYEVVVSRDEVQSVRVERISVPIRPDADRATGDA
ncbi:hypothetical protein [Microtetraspora malaysiensis]|uniref:Uncharacterized protein n=1 Tax=Microtetraspora malaysiensis TaxID=161358 RepID=A0ABW6SVA3_9ACTN